MTATTYLNEIVPNQHTFPRSQVLQLLEDYWQKKKEAYAKARDSFNSEAWASQHNIEQIRNQLKKDKEK